VDLKVCSRCQKPKLVTEFRSAKMTADGLHPWCRPCDTAYARERRAAMPKKPDRRLAFRPPTWTPPSSAAALAYLAGIIDGEGTICFQEKSNGTRQYRVAVIMTSEETIRWLGQWGGTVTALPMRRGSKSHWKPQWSWRVTSHSNVRLVLTAVMPYLVTKKQTAAEALDYIATRPGASAPCPVLGSMVLQVPHHAAAVSPARE
jgi:hypothetical protein